MNNLFCGFLILFLSIFSKVLVNEASNSSKPLLNLTTGQIEGLFYRTQRGRQANVFFQIPYAEAPIGDLRFAKTVPKLPWNGTLQSFHGYGAACPQNVSISQFGNQSEDCLFVNVFAGTQCTNESQCPVLYYVHGGANEFESPSMFPVEDLVDNFASEGIVLVTIAYRLGLLGFFSTGSANFSGNWAIEDILEGARWVQREIETFGGAAPNVTLMGHSSSSSLVSLLSMTPRAEGLFQRAVVMSGSGVQWNAIDNDLSSYSNLSRTLRCWNDSFGDGLNHSDSIGVVQCLRKFHATDLINQFNTLRGYDETGVLLKNMTTVRNDGPSGIFPEALQEMISKRRQLPFMIGTTKYENGLAKVKLISANPGHIVRACMDAVFSNGAIRRKTQIVQACAFEYMLNNHGDYDDFGQERTRRRTSFSFWTNQAVAVQEDMEYYAPVSLEVASLLRNQSITSPSTDNQVYIYSFDYEKPELAGVYPWHATDMSFVFGSHKLHQKFTDQDKLVQQRYLPLFINFVKYGNPTPEPVFGTIWQPANGHNEGYYPYLSVSEKLEMKSNYRQKADAFWNQIVPRYESSDSFDEDISQKVKTLSKSAPEMLDQLYTLYNWTGFDTNATVQHGKISNSKEKTVTQSKNYLFWEIVGFLGILTVAFGLMGAIKKIKTAKDESALRRDDETLPILMRSYGSTNDASFN